MIGCCYFNRFSSNKEKTPLEESREILNEYKKEKKEKKMIDYLKIAKSVEFYEKKGYMRLEVPWMISQEIAQLTKPPQAKDYIIKESEKVLVASAELSFLYLANKGQLPKGMYQATTPCFRNEPVDLLHRKNFIKNELINTKNISHKQLKETINDAFLFFSLYIDKKKLKIVKTEAYKSDINYDIVVLVNNEELELGSYGIRQCEILKWIYGTGLAEPRLTLIMNRLKMQKG